jgi:hypothetical protein
MFVLGLGYRARQGKDTVAKAIVQECGRTGFYAKQYAFADALKAYCRVAFGMREKDAPLLQYMGTNVFRKTDPGIWVRVLQDTIAEQQPDIAIITDMRFPNEADAVVAMGGYTMKVERYEPEDGMPWITRDRDPQHPSETALRDYVFDESVQAPDGDVDELIRVGLRAFQRLYKRHITEQIRREAA